MTILILLLLGLFAGVMSGLLGIGGGTIFTPVLFYFFNDAGVENPELWTIGTSLFCTFSATSGGTIRQIQQKSAFLRESFVVGLFGVVGTALGKFVATSNWFTTDEFLVLIAAVLLYTGVNFMFNSYKTRRHTKELATDRVLNPTDSAVIGASGGILAAISGLGGGIVMVPIMNLGYKYSLRKSVSVAQFAIVIISMAGFIQYMLRSPNADSVGQTTDYITVTSYTIGYLDFGASLPLVIGSFIGAGFGVWLHDRINTSRIKFIFGILVIFVSIRMFLELWM